MTGSFAQRDCFTVLHSFNRESPFLRSEIKTREEVGRGVKSVKCATQRCTQGAVPAVLAMYRVGGCTYLGVREEYIHHCALPMGVRRGIAQALLSSPGPRVSSSLLPVRSRRSLVGTRRPLFGPCCVLLARLNPQVGKLLNPRLRDGVTGDA